MSDKEKMISGYAALAEYLTGEGFPISKGTLQKYCSPSVNTGPPHEFFWGQKKTFRPSIALKWARDRLKPEAPPTKRWPSHPPAAAEQEKIPNP
jgi:hypothetical protein